MNFSSVTPEFKKGKYVHLVDQQFGYSAPLLDLAGICTEFSRVITTQFYFTCTLDGVTAMLRGLHARHCHTFIVLPYRITGTIRYDTVYLRVLKI